jgi:hypothetical protein
MRDLARPQWAQYHGGYAETKAARIAALLIVHGPDRFMTNALLLV